MHKATQQLACLVIIQGDLLDLSRQTIPYLRARLVWVPGYHSFPQWAIIGVNKIVCYTEDFVMESGSLYQGSTVLSNLLPRAILNFFFFFTKNEAWVLRYLENKIKSNYLTFDSFIICLFAEKLLEISPRSRPRALYMMSSHRSIPQIIRKPIVCACFWSYIRQILFFSRYCREESAGPHKAR